MVYVPKYKKFNQERQIGEHTIYLPDPPDLHKIAYRDLPKEKQFFRRTYLPKNWDFMLKEERNEFANREWDRRGREGEKGEGFWFMNNGNLEWMSPTHYFYCNWWRIGKVQIPNEYYSDPRDRYYPFFTDADRDWHYLADDCFWDKHCGGLFTIEFRRGGKTVRISSYQYEKVSKTHDAKGGTQSRDDTDSYNVFEKIVFGWRNLPPFFKPVDTGNNNPVTNLVFDEPKKVSTKNLKKTYSDVLHSWIDYGNASEGFYDGKEQLINIQDEIGKINAKRGVNLLERIRVVVECCFIMGEKVGMVLGTTTVEEMEKAGGKQAKDLWLRCTTLDEEAKLNPKIFPMGKAVDELGYTNSKLKRYFRPSFKGFLGLDSKGKCFVDRYGYSDEERTKEYFLKKRANKKGAELASEKRKFPLEINDCWVSDVKKSTYDTDRIEQQLEHNQTLPPNVLPIRGNFVWANGKADTTVEWHPCENGRWLVAWLPPFEKRNKSIMRFGKKAPANTEDGAFGLDPYDNKVTVDDRKSDAASYGYRKFDPMSPYDTGIFICQYVNRPPLPEIMWEDMILQAVFYGWEILIENNKIGTINHFRQRGYYNYLMDRPEETMVKNAPTDPDKMEKGIPMSGDEARMSLIYATESYIVNKVGLIEKEGEKPYMGKNPFNELLTDWLEFDFEQKWTKFDKMVGAGLALLGARKHTPKPTEAKVYKFFNTYALQGNQSVIKR
jgi:hypothetical protein